MNDKILVLKTMHQIVIKWKLHEFLSIQRKTSRDLAQFMGVHENSVYRLRKSQVMPRLTHETLDKICEFLDCSPGDLLVREKEEKL